MAEKDETNMIGYDPLAWMHEAEPRSRQIESSDLQSTAAQSALADQSEESVSKSGRETIDIVEADIEMADESYVAVAEEELATASDPVLPANTCQIVLEPTQNIQNAGQLYAQLLKALDDSDNIDIDASAITMIDTATLQLLLVLKRTAIKLQKNVAIDFPSDKFIEAAALLGLSEMLNVDQAASGFF